MDQVGEDGLGMIQVHYMYYALYFYFYYYIVTYNEIITQLIIMQNEWEPWACLLASRQSHLGIMGDRGSRPPVLASPPQLHLRSSGIRFSQGTRHLDPSHVQFTVMILWESNAATDLTEGRAQAVMQAMGSDCKYRCSFSHLPALTPCCAAWLLTGHGPVPLHGLGIGDPPYRLLTIESLTLAEIGTFQNIGVCCFLLASFSKFIWKAKRKKKNRWTWTCSQQAICKLR